MDEKYLISLGKRMLERRKALNLTQEKVAEYANVTKQTIQTAEKGQKELKAKSIIGIAEALQVSTDYLLNGVQTEFDLFLLDRKAIRLSNDQFNSLFKIYNEFLKLCNVDKAE